MGGDDYEGEIPTEALPEDDVESGEKKPAAPKDVEKPTVPPVEGEVKPLQNPPEEEAAPKAEEDPQE